MRFERRDAGLRRPLRGAGWLVGIVAALWGLAAPADAQPLPPVAGEGATILLTHARLVDPTARTVADASILVLDGRVRARGDAGGEELAAENPDVPQLDLGNRFVFPGLVDLRIHGGAQRSPGHEDELGAAGTSKLLAAAGITSYVDLHMAAEARAWQRRQEQTGSKSSRLAVGFPVLTAPGGRGADLPTARLISTDADADSVLEEVAPYHGARRSQSISIVYDSRSGFRRLPREVLAHLMAAMRQRSLPMVVEVGTWRDVEEALSEGARVLCHIPEGKIPESTLEAVKKSRPRWIPTVAVGADFVELLTDPQLRADPLLRSLAPPDLIDDYPKVRIPQTSFADARERRREAYAAVATLDTAGVRWLAGSDAGAVGTFFGWSLHRELAHWEQAGIPLAKILRGATVDAAAWMGLRYGFTDGSLADFLVLDASPLESLDVLRRPSAVIIRGRWVEPPALLSTVTRQVTEHLPANPIPFGGRLGLLILVVAGFAVLLTIRGVIRRAAREGETT